MRIERDSLGEVAVPDDALWGAQTQRAIDNFAVSGLAMPPAFVQALGLIKQCAAEVNGRLGVLSPDVALAVAAAAAEVAAGQHADAFPVDVFQTGSGTSSNMNANEVIARLASGLGEAAVHPNDHVNAGQSSNDVIPTAIHVSAVLQVETVLLPALEGLGDAIQAQAAGVEDLVKTGRTHLMDAMPVTAAQELSGWAVQVTQAADRIRGALGPCRKLAQGGTAVGTGVNSHPAFAAAFVMTLAERAGTAFEVSDNYFASLSGQDAAVALSGQLRAGAAALMKIANDLRWMNSGPLAGFGEVRLEALAPGSSIMPGKVNPVGPEAAAMACAQIYGNDVTIGLAGQSGNFQLNVMLPLVAQNLLSSIQLLAGAARQLNHNAIAGMTFEREALAEQVARNPILVTALNARIGYDRAAEIAKEAYRSGRPVLDVAAERTDLTRDELAHLLDPRRLTTPHEGDTHG